MSRRLPGLVASVALLCSGLPPGSGLFGSGAAAGVMMSKSLPPRTLSQIIPGSYMEVTLREGEVLRGDFAGGGRTSDEEYARRYGTWHATSVGAGWFPRLDDTIAVSDAAGHRVSGTFRGFNYRGIEFHAAGDSTARLTTYGNFATLEGAPDHTIAADSLDHLDAEGRLPSLARFQVKVGRRVVTVPVDQVVSLKIPQSLLQKLAATGPAGEAGATVVGVGAAAGVAVSVWLMLSALAAGMVAYFTWWMPKN